MDAENGSFATARRHVKSSDVAVEAGFPAAGYWMCGGPSSMRLRAWLYMQLVDECDDLKVLPFAICGVARVTTDEKVLLLLRSGLFARSQVVLRRLEDDISMGPTDHSLVCKLPELRGSVPERARVLLLDELETRRQGPC